MIESGSSIGVFMSCPKKYEFNYEKRLGSLFYKSALGYGSFIHAGVEVLSGKGRADSLDSTLFELLEQHKDPSAQADIRSDYELAKRVVKLWHESWSNPAHPFSNANIEWQKSEFEWSFNIEGTEFVHVGKSDGVVLHKKYGKLFLYELKTAADRSRDTYVHRLQVDKQISSNIIALRKMGIDVEGVIYDVIWKPGLKRLKDRKTKPDETLAEFHARIFETMKENPSEHFERHIVYRTEKDIEEYEKDLRSQFEALYIARKKKAFYRNSGACENFGSLCEFFTCCIEGKEEFEQLLHKRSRRLPELSESVQ